MRGLEHRFKNQRVDELEASFEHNPSDVNELEASVEHPEVDELEARFDSDVNELEAVSTQRGMNWKPVLNTILQL